MDIPSFKQALKDRGVDIEGLENTFKTSLDTALGNFKSEDEAKEFVGRATQNQIIDRWEEYHEDSGTGRGLTPESVWKKECRFCRSVFETKDRRQFYCDSPGHKQRYYERKKSAELYLEAHRLLEVENVVNNIPS